MASSTLSATVNKPLVVITGASSGIGEACAKVFSAAGYPLLLLARRLDCLHALQLPDNVICAQVDVTNAVQFKQAVDEAVEKYGPVDCFVNNAGVMIAGLAYTQKPEEWQQMIDTNLTGVLNGIHTILPSMIERRGGTIINIGSLAGQKTFPYHAVYCATKFGVHALTEQIRQEASQYDVRVIHIAPGTVKTELASYSLEAHISNNNVAQNVIIPSLTPTNIANMVLFAYQQPQNICIRDLVMANTRQSQ